MKIRMNFEVVLTERFTYGIEYYNDYSVYEIDTGIEEFLDRVKKVTLSKFAEQKEYEKLLITFENKRDIPKLVESINNSIPLHKEISIYEIVEILDKILSEHYVCRISFTASGVEFKCSNLYSLSESFTLDLIERRKTNKK